MHRRYLSFHNFAFRKLYSNWIRLRNGNTKMKRPKELAKPTEMKTIFTLPLTKVTRQKSLFNTSNTYWNWNTFQFHSFFFCLNKMLCWLLVEMNTRNVMCKRQPSNEQQHFQASYYLTIFRSINFKFKWIMFSRQNAKCEQRTCLNICNAYHTQTMVEVFKYCWRWWM